MAEPPLHSVNMLSLSLSCVTWLELNSKAPFNDLCLLEFYSDVSSRSLSGLVTGNAYDRNDRELSLLRVTKKQLWLPYCLLPLISHSGGTKLLCWEHPPVILPYRLLASVQSGKSLQAQESPERLWPDMLSRAQLRSMFPQSPRPEAIPEPRAEEPGRGCVLVIAPMICLLKKTWRTHQENGFKGWLIDCVYGRWFPAFLLDVQ